MRLLFPDSDKKVWQLSEVEPRSFVRAEGIPTLIAPPPSTPPKEIILNTMPEVLDQGDLPAGPVFSAGYAATSALFHQRMSSYRCSPAFLFRMLNGSEAKAVELIDVLRFLQSSGCARLSLLPYRMPGDYGRQPDNLAVRDARNFRIQGFARVDLTDMEQIRNHLVLGRVVVTSLVLPENLVAFSGSVYGDPVGDVQGRQSFALIGFDAERERVLVQNSMGERWGKKGRVWIPIAWYVRLVIDAYVIY
jgi:hypothetical protein